MCVPHVLSCGQIRQQLKLWKTICGKYTVYHKNLVLSCLSCASFRVKATADSVPNSINLSLPLLVCPSLFPSVVANSFAKSMFFLCRWNKSIVSVCRTQIQRHCQRLHCFSISYLAQQDKYFKEEVWSRKTWRLRKLFLAIVAGQRTPLQETVINTGILMSTHFVFITPTRWISMHIMISMSKYLIKLLLNLFHSSINQFFVPFFVSLLK